MASEEEVELLVELLLPDVELEEPSLISLK